MANKLIIFDFDGVLVNTEYTTFNFYRELLPRYGINLKEEDFKYKIGRKSIDFFRDVLKDRFDNKLVSELIQQKRSTFLTDVKQYLQVIPGAFELLEACKRARLHIALGSQNERDLIQRALDEFGIRHYFEVLTSLQDITQKKPHPEVFFLVTNTLKISPSESVIIEDSPHGIEAAKVGGFKSVGMTTSFSRRELAQADLIVDTVTELTPERLMTL